MKRLFIAAVAAVLTAYAAPAPAAEGLPGATVRTDSGKSAAARRARMEERCKAEPEKCHEMQAKMQARREQHFKRADVNSDGKLTREEAKKGMPGVARHFDQVDANKDGVVTMEELHAARKARAGQRKGPGTSLHPDRAA